MTELSTDAAVGTEIIATASVEASKDGHIHYDWLLTGDSDGLSLVWDNETDGSIATIAVVDGFDQVQSGTCTVTCSANGTELDSADITITRVEPEVQVQSEPVKATRKKSTK